MVNNLVFTSVRTLGEASMAHAIRVLECILVEHTPFIVLSSALHIHWVIANKLELAKTIVAVVGACSGVDDGNSTTRTSELFWTFIGRKMDIKRATIWDLFTWVGGYAYDFLFREIRAYGP